MAKIFGEVGYREAIDIINALFGDAIRSLHLNATQAFAYAYDETETLRDRDLPSSWIVTLTALFVCAKKHGSQINSENLFTSDVLSELSVAYDSASSAIFDELKIDEVESLELAEDLRVVADEYLKRELILLR
jgi:hypothetical protein